MCPNTGRDPVHDFEVVMAELASFSDELAQEADDRGRHQDGCRAGSRARSRRCKGCAKKRGLPFFKISSVTGEGIEELKRAMAERVLAPSDTPAPETVSH